MTIVTKYLIVSAAGEAALRKTRPSGRDLGINEICFPLIIEVPQLWGRVLDDHAIRLALPAPHIPDITIDGPITVQDFEAAEAAQAFTESLLADDKN